MASGVPLGYVRRERGSSVLVLREDVADRLEASGVEDPETLRAHARVAYEGRGRPFGVTLDGVGDVFVRPYLRGGLLRHVNADRYASDARFLRELEATEQAAAAGVPVCRPLGVVSRAAALGTRRGWLLLEEVAGATDVLAFLDGSPPLVTRRATLAASGEAMRALHDAGFEHPDLHLKNLLLAPPGRLLVVDLDRVRRHPQLSRARRLAGLFRFDRHAAKAAAAGSQVSRVDRLRVLRAYAGADWPGRAELRELAEALRRHIARHVSVRAGA